MARLLLAESDDAVRIPLASRLRDSHFEIEVCATSQEVLESLRRRPFDLILSGFDPASPAGGEVLEAMHLHSPGARFWVLADAETTGGSDGVDPRMAHPTDPEKVARKIELLFIERPAVPRPGEPSSEATALPPVLVGSSSGMEDLRRQIFRLADSPPALLLLGETGTGKELVARAIHRASPRREEPFTVIPCSAFPETVLEDQLFGGGPGAARPGVLEATGRGTVLIDEAEALPMPFQSRIVHALKAAELQPGGPGSPRSPRSRVIFSSRQPLGPLAQAGSFHPALYSRLAGFELQIPPLRSRRGDLGQIVRTLLARLANSARRAVPRLSSEAWSALEQHPWPGNVRELANVLERAMVLADGPVITPGELPVSFRPMADLPGTNLRQARRAFEQTFIQRVLDECGGDKIRAARELGIGLTSLYRKLEELSRDQSRGARYSPAGRMPTSPGADLPRRLS